MPCLSRILFLFCLATLSVRGQNDLDTIMERTADWFKDILPKNAPTLPTLPPLPTTQLAGIPIAPIAVTPPSLPTFPTLPTMMAQPPAPFVFSTLPPFPNAPLKWNMTTPSFPTFPPPSTFPPMNFSMMNFNSSNGATIPPVNITLDPEALMSVPEIITHWGYPVEEYNVVTRDGYVLTLHRIPHGKNEKRAKPGRPVVFLQHGLLCTSSIWLLNLPKQSAGFVFADAGFDVWLGNMRGNTYSKGHLTMDSKQHPYWRFSWEEMARHDLDALVDGVLNATGQHDLYYVGHSQGTLTMFAKLASDVKFASKIRKFFALAPVTRMDHIKGMFHTLGEMYDQLKLFYAMIGDHEFLSNNLFTRLLTDLLCDRKMKNPLCEDFIYQVSGPDSNQFNKTRIGIYLAHNPAGTSWKNVIHYAQMVRSGRMTPYDHGEEFNRRVYGTSQPPEYDLRRITTPTYLFYSDADWLATSRGVENFLLKTIDENVIRFAKKLRDFNHNDFLWGLRARREIYDPIVDVISLDHRRLRVQEGLRKYLQTKSEGFTPSMKDVFLRELDNSVELN